MDKVLYLLTQRWFQNLYDQDFLHAMPWLPDDEKSPLSQFVRARTIDERDVTTQLWWRHNTKSETTVFGNNCEMSDRWLFLAELCVKDIK